MIFKVSDFKSTNFILHTVILTPFNRPTLADSHFLKFNFKSEKEENVWKILSSSKIDCFFLYKKVVSSEYWKWWSQVSRPSMGLLFVMS